MTLALFLTGLLFGLLIAAPVGPIGILCIRRSLRDGTAAGLATGLGAASADAIYGCVAACGSSALSGFLIAHRDWVGVTGGLILCIIGGRIFASRPPRDSSPEGTRTGLLGAWGSTFLLTLANPATILSFAAIFGAYAREITGFARTSLFVAGVFAGSAAWWLFLSSVVGRLRTYMIPPRMVVINRISGAFLVGFGILAVVRR